MEAILIRFKKAQIEHMRSVKDLVGTPISVYVRELVAKDMYGISSGYTQPQERTKTEIKRMVETRTTITTGPQLGNNTALMDELKEKLKGRSERCEVVVSIEEE